MIDSSAFGVVSALIIGYLVGSIPWAYIIVRLVAREDVTQHGTGNVGAMNVRRSTGSWAWFAVAMFADGFKGLIPVAIAKGLVGHFSIAWIIAPASTQAAASHLSLLLPQAMLAGAVLGHNYSIWMALLKKKFARTGKGLATGGGALLAYDWRYFVAVVVVGLAVIAITRYMMAGQVAASLALPLAAVVLRSPDWPFMLVMGLVIYAAHHKRFVGLLSGREPKLYVDDRMGPKG
ncbi:MAG: glycerol-3-phosphate acyltransferase [Coriobacteriia bacterium]|nr:glycerol-3-phosphate acyltransferase [Coriobacteriia bacterium]